MQVATLFRESATLLGAASMIESPSSNSSSSLLSSSSLVSSTNSILGGGCGGGGGGGTSIASCTNLGNLDNCQTDDCGYFNNNNNNTNCVLATATINTTNTIATIKSGLSPSSPIAQTMLSPMIPIGSGICDPHDNSLNSNFNFSCNETDTNLDPKQQQVTCLIDHNHGYKLLPPTGKPEVHDDDGYETSNGATPNQQHNHNIVMLPRHEISLPTATDNNDPYNFIDDDNFTQYHHYHHHHHHHHHNQNDMMHIEQTEMVSPPQSQQHHHHNNNNNQHNHHHQIQQQISDHHHINIQQQQQHHQQQQQQPQNITITTNINTAINSGTVLTTTTTTTATPAATPAKKRGRKKKSGNVDTYVDGDPQNIGPIKSIVIKERKKHDRFNGMSEEEVTRRTLPDHLANNLDIIIIGINPGLFAAYKEHHYAGPGNHFWKCLYLSGLTRDQMTADDDYKLLDFGIGFTNMVSRPTKGSADLTRKEIKEGSRLLMEKLKKYRPKIAVFNGKLIYEVFSGKKDFNFGRQPGTVDGTNTYMWVMPSSSARCAQLPRAADKVPFYAALKKFRDYLNGVITELDETDIIVNEPIKYSNNSNSNNINSNNDIDNNLEFNVDNSNNLIKSELLLDEKNVNCCEIMNLDNNSSNSGLTDLSGRNITNGSNNNTNLLNYSNSNQNLMTLNYSTYTMDGDPGTNTHHQLNNMLSNKKKRGRPKKDKATMSGSLTDCDNTNSLLLIDSINKNLDCNPFTYSHHHQHHIYNSSDIIKKKRGRPKKIKVSGGNSGNNSSSSNHNVEYNSYSNQNFCIPQSENSLSLLDIGYANNSATNNSSDTNNNDNCSNSSISIDSSKKCNKDGGTDVATKSLSGLESLVDQIPSISDEPRIGGGGGGGGGNGGGLLPNQAGQLIDATEQYNNSASMQNCVYTQNYATSQAQSAYLLPAAPTSPHHHYNFIESPHVPIPVNPLYHHPHHHHHHPSLAYGQQNYHHHHSSYSNVPPPTLHNMSSPNYPPYGYTINHPPLPPPPNYEHSHQNTTYLNNQLSHNMFGGDRMPTPTTPNKPHQQTELTGGNFENF